MKKIAAMFLNPIFAVINVLESKGILTKEEVNEEIKRFEEEDKKA